MKSAGGLLARRPGHRRGELWTGAPANCDNNVWQDNVFGSADAPCAANGTQIRPPPSKPARPPSPPEDVPPPRRGSKT